MSNIPYSSGLFGTDFSSATSPYSQFQTYGTGYGDTTPFIFGLQTPNFSAQSTGLNQGLFDKAVGSAVTSGNKNWKTILNGILQYGGTALLILKQTGVIKSNNDLYAGNFDASKLSQYSSDLSNIQEPTESSFLGLNQNNILLIGVGLLLFFGLGNNAKKSK